MSTFYVSIVFQGSFSLSHQLEQKLSFVESSIEMVAHVCGLAMFEFDGVGNMSVNAFSEHSQCLSDIYFVIFLHLIAYTTLLVVQVSLCVWCGSLTDYAP